MDDSRLVVAAYLWLLNEGHISPINGDDSIADRCDICDVVLKRYVIDRNTTAVDIVNNYILYPDFYGGYHPTRDLHEHFMEEHEDLLTYAYLAGTQIDL